MKPGRPVEASLIARVKALWLEGKTQEAIAVEVGLTQGTVSRILRGVGGGRNRAFN